MKKLSTYTDNELLTLLKGNKKEAEEAFTEIYDRYSVKVNAYCVSILGDRDHAADIFQETFMKFFQSAKSDSGGGTIIGFLITIARNLCLNAKRDRKFTVPIEQFQFPESGGSDSVEEKEISELLTMALDIVGDDFKEAMVMRYFNGMRYEEIGEILEITAARARYLVFTGKQKLKTILDPYLKGVYN